MSSFNTCKLVGRGRRKRGTDSIEKDFGEKFGGSGGENDRAEMFRFRGVWDFRNEGETGSDSGRRNGVDLKEDRVKEVKQVLTKAGARDGMKQFIGYTIIPTRFA